MKIRRYLTIQIAALLVKTS